MEQARVLDIHKYYRHGGVNWELVKLNFDMVIISAGVGLNENHLIEEQVQGCNANGLPYMTYLIPDVSAGSMESQADHYLDLPGVREAQTCTDVEKPNNDTPCINEHQTLAFNRRIEHNTARSPWMYSRANLIDPWGAVGWLPDYCWWIAQYMYENYLLKRQFTSFASFLARYGGQLPPSTQNKSYRGNVKLWQFSSKGPARQLCANEHTLDPVYTHGMLEADLNVSTVEKSDFMAWFTGAPVPPPPPPPPPQVVGKFEVLADVLNVRSGPNTTYPVVGTLSNGDQGDVFATGGINVWYKIGEARWIASCVNGKEYSRLK